MYCHPLAGFLWKRQLEEFLLKEKTKKPKVGNACLPSKRQPVFLSAYVDVIKVVGSQRKFSADDCERRSNLKIQTSLSSTFGMYSKSSQQPKCSKHLQRQMWKDFTEVKQVTMLSRYYHGVTTRKATRSNLWNDNVNWQRNQCLMLSRCGRQVLTTIICR